MKNNHSNNVNGINMYDLTVLKWLCTKACESEFEYPRQNAWQWLYGKSTIREKPSNYKLGSNKITEMMTNNTTPSLAIIISTYIKLARPKPSPIYKKNPNDGNKVNEL